MKFKKDGFTYEVEFFFGRTGVPKEQMDETTPCVRATTGESFNVVECDWEQENQYAMIYEALCRVPIHQDKTPSEVAMMARELADGGYSVVDGRILDADGEEIWPIGSKTGSIGLGKEPTNW